MLKYENCLFIADVLDGIIGPSTVNQTSVEVDHEREHVAKIYKETKAGHPGWSFTDCARYAKATWLNAYLQDVASGCEWG